MLTNDMYNANTGDFDPRHMFGVTNQDVFRWPGIKQGTERMLLGYFITTILLPGIPLVFYGEEQAFYVLDSTAQNYLYGRQGMSAALAWKMHGCYTAGTTIYVDWPAEKVLTGCNDESVAYDHRDASHPIRNVIKHMFELRAQPNLRVLDDGWVLTKLANKTEHIMLVEETTATEFGIWSVARSMHHSTITDQQVTPIWLVYHNRGQKFHYNLDCSGRDAFVAPFDAGTTVKNLFSPYDEITLGSATTKKSGFGSGATGCIDMITMEPYGFRAYVPVNQWTGPSTMITDFTPGHDTPINAAEANGVVKIGLRFSEVMESCSAVTDAITIKSTVEGTNGTAKIDLSSVKCEELGNEDKPPYAGAIASRYSWTANLIEVADGIHSITVKDAKSKRGSTGSIECRSDGQPDRLPIQGKLFEHIVGGGCRRGFLRQPPGPRCVKVAIQHELGFVLESVGNLQGWYGISNQDQYFGVERCEAPGVARSSRHGAILERTVGLLVLPSER